jgi:hypothetical protein
MGDAVYVDSTCPSFVYLRRVITFYCYNDNHDSGRRIPGHGDGKLQIYLRDIGLLVLLRN